MLKKLSFFYRVFRISPEIAFRKIYDIFLSNLTKNRKRLDDIERSTFFFSESGNPLDNKLKSEDSLKQRISKFDISPKSSSLDKFRSTDALKIEYGYIKIPDYDNLSSNKNLIIEVCKNVLNHKFNLLGSGWVNVCHGCETNGLEGINYPPAEKFFSWDSLLKRNINPNNQEKCLQVANLISCSYIPIDWQLDFKSGYRWDESEWSFDIKYGNIKGADIKVPWELGRMQHLVWLAYSYQITINNSQFTIDKSPVNSQQSTVEDVSQLTINNSQFTIDKSPVNSQQSTVEDVSQLTIHNSQFTIDKSPVNSQPSTAEDVSQLTINNSQLTIDKSLVNSQQSTVEDVSQLTINNSQLTIGNNELKTQNSKLPTDNGQQTTDNKYLLEFKNEILDFIASNPPRFGVQWMCTMDVGIRAVNWLIAYDLFKSAGVQFDDEFEEIFTQSLLEHGLHISQNLEWSSGLRGNHYFTNMCALMFLGAYLKTNELTNTWLAFTIQEFINETNEQFLPDGGNFEASLPYHYFVFDMFLISLVLLHSLDKNKVENLKKKKYLDIFINKKVHPYEKQKFKISSEGDLVFPDLFWERLNAIVSFSLFVIDKSGNSFQVGDNDSGRFVKFTPPYKTSDNGELTDNTNAELSSISFLSGMLGIETSNNKLCDIIERNTSLEYHISKNLINKKARNYVVNIEQFFEDFGFDIDSIESIAFNDFGIYLNKTNKYSSLVRCGTIGQRGKGGHSHNDNLSLCLNIGYNAVLIDPGTYLYTPIPELRNLFRSTKMHNTLEIPGKEQNSWSNYSKDDLFWLKGDRAKAKVLEFSDRIFIGEHFGYGKPHKRIITFADDYIEGIDMCDVYGYKKVHFHFAPNMNIAFSDKNQITVTCESINLILKSSNAELKIEEYNYSPAYGVIIPAKKVILKSTLNKINWQFDIL